MQKSESLAENAEYVENTIRPPSFIVICIIGASYSYILASSVSVFFCDPLPKWNILFDTKEYFDAAIAGGIALILFAVFIPLFLFFKGVRYRIYSDRIEYQRGKTPRFSAIQTLSFENSLAIDWNVTSVSDDNPNDTVYLKFRFANRRFPFRLHEPFDLSSPIVKFCEKIERETLAPRIHQKLENGEKVAWETLSITRSGITDSAGNEIPWSEVQSLTFVPGKLSRLRNYFVQCGIRIQGNSDLVLHSDIPSENPLALWTVFMQYCTESHGGQQIPVIDPPQDVVF